MEYTSFQDLQDKNAGASRDQLQSVYNAIPGAKPVKRLRNRPTALAAIWKALNPPADGDIPLSVSTKRRARRVPKPKAASKAKGKAKAPAVPAEARQPREGSKEAKIIALLGRKSGATLPELMEKLNWLPHTVRGHISSMAKKGYLPKLVSFKNSKAERCYRSVA